jgi:cell division septation protein DedD
MSIQEQEVQEYEITGQSSGVGGVSDAEILQDVASVERETTWRDAFLASLGPKDRHISDEEIFVILNSDIEHDTAAELFAAKGVTLPMYCVWKSKYHHLDLDQLREVRRMELWRTRAIVGIVLAAAVVAVGGILFVIARAVRPQVTTSAQVRSLVDAHPTTKSVVAYASALQAAEVAAGPEIPPAKDTPPTTDTPPPNDTPRLDGLPADPEHGGYKIQVAARPTLQEARALQDQLTSAGYLAYLLPANVGKTDVFRVRVGPFDTLEEAQKIASQLRRNGYNDAWIAP